MRELIVELGLEQPGIPWHCDNQSTIVSARTIGFSGRTRHVDVKLKFTRRECESKRVKVQYVPTDQQLADVLTKRLKRVKHGQFVTAALVNISEYPYTQGIRGIGIGGVCRYRHCV